MNVYFSDYGVGAQDSSVEPMRSEYDEQRALVSTSATVMRASVQAAPTSDARSERTHLYGLSFISQSSASNAKAVKGGTRFLCNVHSPCKLEDVMH